MLAISDNCVELSQSIMASMSLGGIDVEKENSYPSGELSQIYGICTRLKFKDSSLSITVSWPIN